MKSLTEFIAESLKAKFTKINGSVSLSVKSSDYGVNYKVVCDNWYAGWNDMIVMFWSPKSEWAIYFYISEPDTWALLGMDQSIEDPASFCKQAIDDYRYAMEHATVPEVDSISVDNNDIKKIAKKYDAEI